MTLKIFFALVCAACGFAFGAAWGTRQPQPPGPVGRYAAYSGDRTLLFDTATGNICVPAAAAEAAEGVGICGR